MRYGYIVGVHRYILRYILMYEYDFPFFRQSRWMILASGGSYEKFGRDLTTAEMKMCRMSLGSRKLDHIKSQHIRGTLHIKEAIVDKVKAERNDWFAKVYSQDESNIVRKTLSVDIPQMRKRGRPKNSWTGQMRQQQQRYGLTQQERTEIAEMLDL